jgi:hypothetical protein
MSPGMPDPGRRHLRSHLALAASVLLLVGGSILLLGPTHPGREQPRPAFALPDNAQSLNPNSLGRPSRFRTTLSLEQDPMGSTTIKVDVIPEERLPPR